MWNGLLLLLLLSIVMGTASFLAGLVPLQLSLSSRQLRLITALGTGVLVGTSLIVIIPEGIETLYSASRSARDHSTSSLHQRAVLHAPAGFSHTVVEGIWARDTPQIPGFVDTEHPGFRSGPDDGFQTPEEAAGSRPSSSDQGHEPGVPTQAMPGGAKIQVKDREPHVWVGLSLILGFILMYLIDTLPQHTTKSSRPQSLHISLGQFNFNRTSGSNSEPELPPSSADLDHSPHGPRPASTTIGLVIHGVADGIALGASSTASSSNLSFVIFIALMIHKAPAAFGLTSVLLKQGLSKRTARAHLIIFSLAAPVGAIFTFLFIHFLGLASALGGSSSTDFFTGTLLLFSGGTFLYVAMHTMQDNASATASHSSAGTETGMNGYAGVPLNDPYGVPAPAPAKAAPSGLTDALVTVGGMLLPLLTQFGHSH